MSQIIRLRCNTQNYAWGKPAAESLVAEFTNNTGRKERYAELWMGTHPRGHSVIMSTGQELSSWIAEDLDARLGTLCPEISGKNSGDLPFLLKILSVDMALSLQVHPTKEHAAELHAVAPHHYPDPNHKPEMAIALTVFEGLCGFRPVSEILDNMIGHVELHSHLSQEVVDIINRTKPLSEETSFIKKLFKELVTLENSADIIMEKLMSCDAISESDALFKRIHAQHPGDRGLVCIYLLNHVILQPGECMFLGANKVHAYFSGDCVECMACSDNVVRAGLTSKFVDVQTLIGMVDCNPGTAAAQKLAPARTNEDSIWRYIPPVKDFAVDKVLCVNKELTLPCKKSPQIMLCTDGRGSISTDNSTEMFVRGDVVFVVPGVAVKVIGDLTLFSAYCQG
jgi:mannose-6-phosphate isomerase